MFSVEEKNSIAHITIDDGRVNAMDIEFCESLIEHLDQLRSDDCRAVVLAGNGNVFSAGIDLKRWLREDSRYVMPFMEKLEQLFEAVFCFQKPIIAQIDGHAIAGGCMVAAACDYRVIGDDVKIGIHESRLGVVLPMMAIEILRHVTSGSAFRNIAMLGATYRGSQAVDVGLADAVASRSEMAAVVEKAAEDLAAMPLAAFQLTKQQVRRPVMRIVRDNQREFSQQYSAIWQSPETRSAIQSYVQERLS